ncbi:hypothetical protein AAVH_31397 [Aphelenchoides avenae]|nr:hypothetical protein AAVH_31397 [Aphelenchus avenae]
MARLVKPFDNLQELILVDVNNQAEWAFLRDEWALRLRFLSLTHIVHDHAEIDSLGQAEILAYCTDFVHLPKGQSKIVRLHGWRISLEFLERLIKTVAKCNDWITVEGGDVPEFSGNDEDYIRSILRYEDEDDIVDEVRYSSRVGSHRIIVLKKQFGDSVLVTNNPFVTSFHDVWMRDMW